MFVYKIQVNPIRTILKYVCMQVVNPLANNKIFDMTKFKAFADDILKVAKITISPFENVENTVGKGENAGYQHFVLINSVFISLLLQGH